MRGRNARLLIASGVSWVYVQASEPRPLNQGFVGGPAFVPPPPPVVPPVVGKGVFVQPPPFQPNLAPQGGGELVLQRFSVAQQIDVVLDPARSRLGPGDVMQADEEGVPPRSGERLEKRLGFRGAIEGTL